MTIRAFPSRALRASAAVIVLIASASAGIADGLTARISADKIGLGDSFQLRLSADPTKLTAPPDISALNTDFDILGTSQSTQTRIRNGARSDTVEWIINLAPRRIGQLTIPVLTAGTESSEALTLDVVAQSDLPVPPQTASTTSIETRVQPGNHYVQEEIPLTLRVTAGQGFRSGTISAPASPDYILEQRGEDRSSQSTLGGKPVTLIERDYMLRPQKSGALTIAPFVLQGKEDDPTAQALTQQDPFDNVFDQSPFGLMFNAQRDITLRTPPIALDVKANPTNTQEWFLPAKAVEITAEWDPETPQLRVGEAVTRHVRLQALGATQVQLPDLALPQVTNAKIYLESSNAGSVDTAEGTAAVRDFAYSIVPTSGGEITLPEVAVTWFNTASETTQIAKLPAQTLRVEGPSPAPLPTTVQPQASAAVVPTAPKPDRSALAFWVLLAVFFGIGAGWIAYRRRHRGPEAESAPARLALQTKAALLQIETACTDGNAKAAYAAALTWLRMTAQQTGCAQNELLQSVQGLAESWAALEANVFSEQDEPWDATAFKQLISEVNTQFHTHKSTRSAPRMPPLYPSPSIGQPRDLPPVARP